MEKASRKATVKSESKILIFTPRKALWSARRPIPLLKFLKVYF